MASPHIKVATDDIVRSLKGFALAGYLAWEDIRQRYVRTMLGPWWIVISTGVWFAVMGFVMATLFGQTIDTYLPYVFSGLLVWVLITGSIDESPHVLVYASALITSFSIPIFTHYLRFIMRHYIILLHNILIMIVVFCIFPPHFDAAMWLVIPGLLLNMMILLGGAVLLSLANLRYRDTHLAVGSAMQVLPFVTPIFWHRDMLKQHVWIADANPLYHMVEIVRAPLLGETPASLSWIVTGFLALTLMMAACVLFTRYRHRIIFWL